MTNSRVWIPNSTISPVWMPKSTISRVWMSNSTISRVWMSYSTISRVCQTPIWAAAITENSSEAKNSPKKSCLSRKKEIRAWWQGKVSCGNKKIQWCSVLVEIFVWNLQATIERRRRGEKLFESKYRCRKLPRKTFQAGQTIDIWREMWKRR